MHHFHVVLTRVRVWICSGSRFGRRFGRRRFSRKAGYGRRRSKYGRRRMSVKRRIVGASARAAKSTYTGTPMCRDLGTLWPSCMITKLRYHAMMQPFNGSATLGLQSGVRGYYYNNVLNMYPTPGAVTNAATFANGATSNWVDASAAGTSVLSTTGAAGIARLLGSPGASSTTMYQRCCVLSARVVLTIELQPNQISTTNGIFGTGKSYHFLHPLSLTDSTYAAPSSPAATDSFWNQPDVRKKLAGPVTGINMANSSTSNTAYGVAKPGTLVRWKHVIWPHKVYDMPFEEYVGDNGSFGTNASYPTRMGALQFGGFCPSNTNIDGCQIGLIHTEIIFTCLFKDLVGNLS